MLQANQQRFELMQKPKPKLEIEIKQKEEGKLLGTCLRSTHPRS